MRESETKFEVEYLQEKLNFVSTFWYHWKALSKHNHNTNPISQLCYDMMYLCVNIWSYPIVYRAEFFVLIYLATLNLTKMSVSQRGLIKDLKIPLFKAYLWSIRIKSLVDYSKSKLKLEMLVGELLKNVPNSALQGNLFKWAFFMNHEWKYKNYCLTVTRDAEGDLLM